MVIALNIIVLGLSVNFFSLHKKEGWVNTQPSFKLIVLKQIII